MKKIVFFGWKAKSNFNESLSILENIIRNDVRVYYFGFEEYRQAIENMGIKFFQYKDIRKNLEDIYKNETRPKFTVEDIVNRSSVFNRKLLEMFKEMAEYDLEKVKMILPNIIFRDNAAVNGKIVASKLKKRTVGINCLITMLNEDVKSDPVKLFGLFNSVDFTKVKGIKESGFYSRIINRHIKNSEELEVPYINPVHVVDGEDDINISFGGSLIQPDGKFNNKEYIVAKPLLRNMCQDLGHDVRLQEFIDSKEKLIYFATGSTIRASNKFYNIVINTVRRTNYNLIISVPNLSNNYNKKFPQNVLVRDMINQQKILERADLFITAGGYNSVCEAVHNLVPMMVRPIINDQAVNAYKIKELGIGEVIKTDDIDKESLLNYINILINDQMYKSNLQKVKRNFQKSKDIEKILNDILINV
ncbi:MULTISPECIES: nucleotide disphospho-sugar-binding domain-containing protein [Clostridium]|uniref:nucleotide disphospho-sugar-binding domain-containing protein n=1 Tax=Clostridium TaxID=1485 RepID=UPI000825A1BD|nr:MULTISPECIES: nucleotide disphospho-sugar-binding domain-containing protein [Clostridium]